MIYRDKDLDAYIQKQCEDGLRKQIKAIATKTEQTGSPYVYNLQKAEKDGYLRPDLVLTVACTDSTEFHFKDLTPADVRRLVGGLEVVQVKRSPSVMQKMVSQRLEKLRREYETHRRSAVLSNESAAKDPYRQNAPRTHVPPPLPELRTAAVLQDLLQCLKDSSYAAKILDNSGETEVRYGKASANPYHSYGYGKYPKAMWRDLFGPTAPPLTDEQVAAAWDLMTVAEVMSQ